MATTPINLPPPTPIPLNWKRDQPVWIEQWPLKQNKQTKKKMEALHELMNNLTKDILLSPLALGIFQCSLYKRNLVNGECLLI